MMGWTPGNTPVKHGTIYGYKVQKCRCLECRDANRSYQNASNQARAARLVAGGPGPLPKHGAVSTYTNWLCRCDQCSQAHHVKMAAAYARRKAQR